LPQEDIVRTLIGFVVGLLVGTAVAGVAQENRIAGLKGLNHIALTVEHFDDAMAFYTQKMGFKEAFTARNDNGEPILAYLHVSRNTFIELIPSRGRPGGFSHVGLEVEDIKAAINSLRQRGLSVEDPRVGGSKSLVAFTTDPNGVRIELTELAPPSLTRQAIERWK
jgi:catechol 2,3-dioxygenase-like lactoylglutathione lyase family enzyme